MGAKVPILLVDDQPANLLALEAVLDAPGYEFVRAHSGAEAIERLEHAEFAAVLLDIQMPGMDGYETARRIKKLPNGARLPIIFLTAIYKEPEDIKKGYAVGALDYFGKPFDIDLMRTKVGVYADLFARRHARHDRAQHEEAADALRRFRDEIVARWTRLVLDDYRVPAANHLPEPELRDHVPRLIEIMADALQTPEQEAALMALQESRRHARERVAVRYDLSETLRELSHLRVAIHEVLAARGYEPDMASCLAIGRCLDEVMSTDAVEVATLSAQALERAAKVRERFVAVLAHDLRQPIASIQLGAHLLLEDAPDESSADVARRVVRSAERMGEMVRELLDYARTASGETMPFTPADTELGALVQHVIDEALGACPTATIRLRGEHRIRGRWDPARLTQAIANVVTNAITHGAADRPITIILRRDNGTAVVLVHNENRFGPIPSELIADMFSPFRRASRGPTERDGLGLGLYIASEVIRAHGGVITVESTDEGTTFTLRLPMHAATPPARATIAE